MSTITGFNTVAEFSSAISKLATTISKTNASPGSKIRSLTKGIAIQEPRAKVVAVVIDEQDWITRIDIDYPDGGLLTIRVAPPANNREAA